jgi:hypothetical protein
VKGDEMGRARRKIGDKKNAYRILVGKSEANRSRGCPRRRWGDNIKMDPRMEWYSLN